MKNPDLGVHLRRYEKIGGWIFLPFYLVLLELILSYLFVMFALPSDTVTFNLVWQSICLVSVVLIFHRFYADSFSGIFRRFWPFLQAVVLGYVFYYAMLFVLSLLYRYVAPDLQNLNNAAIDAAASSNYAAIVLLSVVAAPIVEETLMRGLIFGTCHSVNRISAYAASALVFSAIHVWRYIGTASVGTIVLCAIEYLPAGIALGWTYEKSGNIWANILLHALLNATSFGLLSLDLNF